MKKGKAPAAFGLMAAILVTGLITPAYGQQSTDEGQRELAGNQVTPSQGIAVSNSTSAASNGVSLTDSHSIPDPASASTVDADGAALQAAISKAIQDLQARRKAQQQAQATKANPSVSRQAPNWEGLSAQERARLQPLSAVWHELPSADRYAWQQLARQFPMLPQTAQDQAQERMKQWSTFTPQQRQAARENFRLAQKLNDSKLSEGQLQALWERYRELTPEQRAVLRAAGQTATTAARHAGAATPLAKEAARPLPALDRHGKPTP